MKHFIVELNQVIGTLKYFVSEYKKLDSKTPEFLNCPSWIAGHSAFGIYDMILRPLGSDFEFPENYHTFFKTGSTRIPESEYPKIEEILETLDKVVNEAKKLIGNLSGGEIGLPKDLREEGFFSIENLITHTIQDIAYHNGQLSYLVRFLNK
ncbi:MAG: DUF664 domain-containing protein [Calditrichaeota bacterium]|nr:MAG: DUF664 domain-containing protein [Calditrichota bacterium]